MPPDLFSPAQREAAERILASVPDWARIYTVAEAEERTRALQSRYGRDVAVETIGRSRQGRSIEALTVGSGPMTVLLLGFPHPDEGVGGLLIDHVLNTALAHPEVLRPFGARVVAVRCWDIDGAALNEGWSPGTSSIEEQAKHHFRPPPAMQMEWTFPVEYKSHRWSKVPPETEAVRLLIDRERPHFMLGLHNAAFHDPYFYLSREAPEAYGALGAAVDAERLHLSERSPDVPFEVPLARGIFRMYGLRDYYDYFERFAPHRLPHLNRGACSDEYLASTVPHAFSFNAEVPRALDRRLRDASPTSRPLREVVLQRTTKQAAEMKRLDDEMAPVLDRNGTGASLVAESVRQHLEEFRTRAKEPSSDVAKDPQYDRSATVSDLFEHEVVGPLEDLLVLGEAWRAACEYARGGDGAARRVEKALSARITGQAAVLRTKSKFEPVPLKRSAGVQLRALLALMAWRVNVMGV